ncbi:MAG TPA: DNA polymerase IV [Firmicutes bacterium]|nr:DNA polymerase IV [Bacillota bacterium]
MGRRTIVHVDMDAFFCAVELLRHPEYAGKPLVVGGRRDSTRAVVSSCSYEARAYGIHSAMPIQKAVRLCPHAIFIPPDHAAYVEVSSRIHALFETMAPVVEPVSIDEAFLDMSGCEHFYDDLTTMGAVIKQRVYETVRCKATVGIAENKLLAKLATDLSKPDGLMVIDRHNMDEILLPLPVRKLWGVGEKTAEQLASLNIHTVADIRKCGPDRLKNLLGSWGSAIYQMALGQDERPVETPKPAKSIGHEVTFAEDIPFGPALFDALSAVSHQTAKRLQKDGRYGRTVHLKVRFSDFKTITRSQTHSEGFNRASFIYNTALSLLKKIPPRPVRLLGVSVSDLQTCRQTSLFSTTDEGRVDELLNKLNSGLKNPLITTAADLAVKTGRFADQVTGPEPPHPARRTTYPPSQKP